MPTELSSERTFACTITACDEAIVVPLETSLASPTMRVRFEGLGASIFGIDRVRLLRGGESVREIEMTALPTILRFAGFATLPFPYLRALCADGALDLIVDIGALLADRDGDAFELRVRTTPLAFEALSTAALDLLEAVHRNPWAEMPAIAEAFEVRGRS